MKTYLECVPCFFKQGIESAKILGADKKIQKQIVDEIAAVIPSFPLTSSPPEMGKIIHDIIKKNLKTDDPYQGLKQTSNRVALSIYQKLKQKVDHSDDRLLTALELSIAGNIIDYGANHSVNPEKEVFKILDKERCLFKKKHFQYDVFKEKLCRSRLILFIGDNAGEIVFDKILVEEIKNLYPDRHIVYAVREKPIINDVTIQDALFVGMDKAADIVSSGSVVPGTLLSQCRQEFLDLFNSANMVISKGQGNFETLSGANNSVPVFFLLTVKCPVVGAKLDAQIGDIILQNTAGNETKQAEWK
jgi:damage-control phosphatase, subfamily I